MFEAGAPGTCRHCGGFIAPGDVGYEAGAHPQCVDVTPAEKTVTVWGPWVLGLVVLALASGVLVWGVL